MCPENQQNNIPPCETEAWTQHPVAIWLMQSRHAPNATETFFTELNERLLEAGIALFRTSCGLLAMHPQVFAYALRWERGQGTSLQERSYDLRDSATYRDSPVYLLHHGIDALRRRLDQENTPLDFPILKELKADGATDYVAMALHFSTGQINYISWATDRPGGFSTRELCFLSALIPLIALRLEIMSAYRLADNLLTTYLGSAAARRVLNGTIRRGEGERLKTALFYCDLRGFTKIADTTDADDLITLLDAYFDCIVDPVTDEGGEVLKFIGDAVLAIFPYHEDESAACCKAMSAALQALHNLTLLNERRRAEGNEPIRAGVGLHVGEIIFGNIGGARRLDFTAIGRAVNEVVRVEELCAELGHPLLTTERFACANCGHKLRPIGVHNLRGILRGAELFALAEENKILPPGAPVPEPA